MWHFSHSNYEKFHTLKCQMYQFRVWNFFTFRMNVEYEPQNLPCWRAAPAGRINAARPPGMPHPKMLHYTFWGSYSTFWGSYYTFRVRNFSHLECEKFHTLNEMCNTNFTVRLFAYNLECQILTPSKKNA